MKGVGSPAEVVQAEAVILSLKNRLVDSLSMRFSFSAADLPALCSIYKSNPFGYGSRRNSAKPQKLLECRRALKRPLHGFSCPVPGARPVASIVVKCFACNPLGAVHCLPDG